MRSILHQYSALARITIMILCSVVCVSAQSEQEIDVWTAHPMKRVKLMEKAPAQASHEITIHACRNEWESAQVVIRGGAKVLGNLHYELISKNIKTSKSQPAFKIYQQFDVQIRKSSPRAPLSRGWYPDVLVPFENKTSPLKSAFRNQEGVVNLRLWIDFHISKDQQPGRYVYTLVVRAPSGQSILGEGQVVVTVLPDVLPNTPSLKSYFGLEEHRIAKIHGLDREEDGIELSEVMERYYQLLADSRLQPGILFASSPPLTDAGKLIWSQPASVTLPAPEQIIKKYFGATGYFNCLHLPMWHDYPFADPLGSDRDKSITYLAQLAKLAKQTAPGAELFFSVGSLDEPDNASTYEQIRKWSSLVHAAAEISGETIKFFVTEQPKPQEKSWGTLDGCVDVWSPHVMWAWEDLESAEGEQFIQKRIQKSDEVWCYPALAQFRDQWKQEKGIPNLQKDSYPPVWLTDYPAVNYRILPWICAAQGLTGIHYWNTFEWPDEANPWDDAGTFIIEDEVFNGDGLLIYPPASAGLIGKRRASEMQPCASIRLKWIRDGMEDYEHLICLKKSNLKLAEQIREEIARGFADWQTTPARIDAARIKISKALNQ